MGDNQGNDSMLMEAIAKMNQEKDAAFVVFVGDFISDGTEASYISHKKMIKNLKIPVYHAEGNHDAMYGGWKLFEKYFGPAYYSFVYKDSRFIVLNNAFQESFTKAQFNWLKNTLSLAKEEHKFVFMHKPTFDPSEIYDDQGMSGRAITQELIGLFSRYKVDYVFAGHIHGYAKAEREGVNYIVTGGGGAQLYLPPDFGGFHHYVRINVDNGRITQKIIKL
ncbi:MAG: metallophosphoesterase [Candidatus Margulisiibacteriota bacterium]